MSLRPTREALVFTGIGASLAAVAATAQAGWLFVLAAAVLGVVVASGLLAARLGRCELQTSLPFRARVGDEIRVTLSATNGGRRALPALRIDHRHPALEPAGAFCEQLGPGRRASAEQVRRCVRRGSFGAGGAVVTSLWPFGAFAARRRVEIAAPFVVVPRWVALRRFPLRQPAPVARDAPLEAARARTGESFAGVREYRPGDDLRRVHWRSTARRGRLVVREHSQAASHRVALVLSGADCGSPPDSAFEALVSAAASVALWVLERGHPLELVRARADGSVEHVSAVGRDHVLDWLAAADPRDGPLGPLLSRAAAAARRGTVIVCATSHGRTGADLAAAPGEREAVSIVADSATWRDGASEGHGAEHPPAAQARLTLRRGEDLRACLER